MLRNTNVSIVEDVKDFVCKPLVIRGETFGGYAKTCPLCNARVDTELRVECEKGKLVIYKV